MDLQRDQFLDFYENAPLGFLSCDREGRIEEFNRTAADMLRLDREDVRRPAFAALVHPRELTAFQAFLRQVRAGSNWVSTELRLCVAEHAMTVQVQGLAAPLADGSAGVRLAVMDVTERKEAEALQGRANRALRALNAVNQAARAAEDEIALLDRVCRFLTSEAGYALAWVGAPVADEAGSVRYLAGAGLTRYLERIWPRMSWADHGCGRGPFGRAVVSGRPAIHPALESDPAFGPWRDQALAFDLNAVTALPLCDQGEVKGVLGIYATDLDAFDGEEMHWLCRLADDLATAWMSVRLRAERQEMARERDRLLEILDATPDFVGMLGWDGYVRYLNPGGRRMLGIESGAAPETVHYRQCHPQWMLERLQREIFPTAEGRGIWRGQGAFLDGGGREIPVAQTVVAHHGPDGRVERFSTIAHDLTPFRRQRAELERHRRLVALGELGSILAHQLNQPLAAAANYVEGSLERLKAAGGEPASVSSGLNQGLDQVHRAGELVRDIRNFLRGGPPRFQEVDLNGLIRQLVPGLTRDQGSLDFQLRVDLATDVPMVAADPLLVQECLVNLVYNGAEAGPQGDGSSPAVMVGTRARREDVEVRVMDGGAGLPPPLRENLDRPLYTTKEHGMGLGLSICRSVVEAHGGRLWATDNRDGPGTTFHFTLPTAERGATHAGIP